MAERLTDEELGELEHAASCADGCDCDCGPSRAAFTCADNVPRLIAEVRQVRKLFEDAGEGQYNVLNLVESYQRNSMEADERLRAVRKLLEENGCECPCDFHADECGPDCEVCLACRIGEAVGEVSSCRATNAKPLDMRKAANEKLNAAIARAEAAEKRVAELEDRLAVSGADLVKRLNDERDNYRERSLGFEKALAGQYARGIREGLERAAVEMSAWSEEHGCRIRAMKDGVK